MMTVLNNTKVHTVKVWSSNWTECTTHDLVIFDALLDDLLQAGIKASIDFNVDGDAYVIKVECTTGTCFEIGPGTLTEINGQEVLTSRVSGLNVYREDGSILTFSEANEFEAFILTVIEACKS